MQPKQERISQELYMGAEVGKGREAKEDKEGNREDR